MLGLIQRVSSAEVVVKGAPGNSVGNIGAGLLLLLGVEKSDTAASRDKLLNKVINYRVFGDEQGHMNLSLLDTAGELLIVSQFTLAADTNKGLRPSFSAAADPVMAERLYDEFVQAAGVLVPTGSGQFGADMKVTLVNDGPVTFMLRS
jgi:D-tyrosyl-tRNA(Tyr) deacylase